MNITGVYMNIIYVKLIDNHIIGEDDTEILEMLWMMICKYYLNHGYYWVYCILDAYDINIV